MCLLMEVSAEEQTLLRQASSDVFSRSLALIFLSQALCLGAKGVGMGRPFLYANSAYGEAGIVRAVSRGCPH